MRLAKKIGSVIFSTMTVYVIVTIVISVNAIMFAAKALEEESSKLLYGLSHDFIMQLVDSKTKSIELEVELARSQVGVVINELRQLVDSSEFNGNYDNSVLLAGIRRISYDLVSEIVVFDLKNKSKVSLPRMLTTPIGYNQYQSLQSMPDDADHHFIRRFHSNELKSLSVRFPVTERDQQRFVIEVHINMDQFLHNILSDEDLKYFRYFLINDEAQLIASDNSIREYLKKELQQIDNGLVTDSEMIDALKRVTAGEFGIADVHTDLGGLVVGFAPVDNINWRLAVVVHENYLISSLDKIFDIIEMVSGTVLRRLFVGTLIFSALLAIVLSVLAKHITNPITELEKWANKVISGEYIIDSKDESTMRKDELGRLQRAFIYMSKHISELVNNLEKRVELRTKELTEARDRAERVNQAKTRFLANVSHELRTPLNAIIGFSEVLKERKHGERDSHLVDSIAASGKNLLYLVNDLLDLTKIDEDKLDIIVKPTSLVDIAAGLESTFCAQATAKGVDLKVFVKPYLPDFLLLDHIRINQVLTNLTSNAVKYTEKGTVVLDIKGEEKSGKWDLEFCVSDTGRGIPESELETIFNVFEQVKSQDSLSGTGLGLAIVKRLVHSMNGELEVKSSVDEGSQFCFRLNQISSCEEAEIAKEKPLVTNMKALANKRVLVVDDIGFNRDVIKLKLEKFGFVIQEAEDGVEALSILKKQTFDLVLTDISMPKMDGIELSQKVRVKWPSLPIVAITARGFIQEEQEIRKYCHDYLRKPIEDQELKRVLAQVF
ncbi:response regulator [Vibrio sonorensis]|uniref:response regulator n=1 Tax=Vibrio sonorensis TaxID=1004316 RepID=UPI0008DB1DBF|nr:response regulator [Vibrio sonorensis]